VQSDVKHTTPNDEHVKQSFSDGEVEKLDDRLYDK